MSKGSHRRPTQVEQAEFDRRWMETFGKPTAPPWTTEQLEMTLARPVGMTPEQIDEFAKQWPPVTIVQHPAEIVTRAPRNQ